MERTALTYKAVQALLQILGDYKPEGIIFDMDGVLADVSSSYRQAIIRTGTEFLLCHRLLFIHITLCSEAFWSGGDRT